MRFDRAVRATGSPRVALTVGTQTRHAAYSMSWRDGRFLQFNYAVQEDDRDEDGIGIPANGLTTGGGTITAVDGAAEADLTHAAETPWHGAKVDGRLATTPAVEGISIISSPARGGTYELGETVEATGDPQVALIVGMQTRYATFSGWGTETLFFEYIVREGDRDEDGIDIAANALVLNRGTITAVDGTTDADLAHDVAPADPNRKVDGSRTAP